MMVLNIRNLQSPKKKRLIRFLEDQGAGMSADITPLADHLERIRRSRPQDSVALTPEMIVLQEGLDLLIAYRSIPDRTTRLLIKALTEAVSPKDGVEQTLHAANINVADQGDPNAS